MLCRMFLMAVCAVSIAGPGVTQNRPTPDPVLGDRLIGGVATRDTLWVFAANGALVRFDRATGDRQTLSERDVADVERRNGRTVALIKAEAPEAGYRLIDADNAMEIAALNVEPEERPNLIWWEDGWGVLAGAALHVLADGGWRRIDLTSEIPSTFGVDVHLAQGSRLFVGRNRGEWGGGLAVFDTSAGTSSKIERIDGDDICNGPLNAACDPITGLIDDPDRPGCVLASIGLSHMLSHGRIVRVCGNSVEVAFEQPIPLPANAFGAGHSTWPFFGLARIVDGWVAVSAGKIFKSRNGVVEEAAMPDLADWRGLSASFEDPSLIILRTDVNWGMSLSGYTPLLIPVTE